MDYKKSYLLLHTGVLSGGATVFIALAVGTSKFVLIGQLLGFLGIIIMMVSFIQALIFFKCPKCARHFDIRNNKLPKYCSECGSKLE